MPRAVPKYHRGGVLRTCLEKSPQQPSAQLEADSENTADGIVCCIRALYVPGRSYRLALTITDNVPAEADWRDIRAVGGRRRPLISLSPTAYPHQFEGGEPSLRFQRPPSFSPPCTAKLYAAGRDREATYGLLPILINL